MPDYDHPDFTLLADWVDGRLDPVAAERVARAVDRDAAAAASVRWLRSFREVAQIMPLELPPPFLHERMRRQLRESYEAWRAEHVGPTAPVPIRLRADLVFDSRRDLAATGMRGIGGQDMIHLAYSVSGALPADAPAGTADDETVIDVVLDAEPMAGDTVRLTGQVLCSHAAPSPFTTVDARRDAGSADGDLASETSIDTLGRFDLGIVGDDITAVTLRSPHAVLVASVALRSGG